MSNLNNPGFFPVAHSLLAPLALLEKVAEDYELNPLQCKFITSKEA